MSGVRQAAATFARSGVISLAVLAAMLMLAGRAVSVSLDHYPDLVSEAPEHRTSR